MKFKVTSLAAASLFTVAAAAHAQTTGVSHPEELNDSITTTAPATPKAKPSPLVPAAPAPVDAAPVVATDAPVLHEHYVPPTKSFEAQAAPVDVATISEDATPADSGYVRAIPAKPNELPEGTVLRAALDATISTAEAKPGDHFTARLTQDVQRDGRVLVPTGAVVRGRVTEVHVGHGFGAAAMLRLQPDTVTMPDGIPYPLNAQVIDLAPGDKFLGPNDSHVRGEGQIYANQHAKAKVVAVSLTTGSGAAAGALLGGGVGALVGATIGAGAGLVVLAKQDHQQTLPEGTVLVLNLDHSLFLNAK